LRSEVLSSHTDALAQGQGNAPREPNVPVAWPGIHVPNLSDWDEGDIVLVEGTGLRGAVIRAAQSASMNLAMLKGARWSHAAVYVGGGMVVEATPPQVRQQPLWNYCRTRAVAVRRLGDPGTSTAVKRSMAAIAVGHVGKPYSTLQAVWAKLGIPNAQAPDPAALFCSTFVGLVVAEATGIRLWSDPKHQPLLPAVLAAHPDLDTVLLEWCNR
jgi:uncharacterized protein YycO